MKPPAPLLLTLLLLAILAFLPGAVRAEEQTATVTLEMQDAPVRDVLRAIAEQTETAVIIDESVEGTLSIKLDAAPAREALQTVAATLGLELVEEEDGILRVRRPPSSEGQRTVLAPSNLVRVIEKVYDVSDLDEHQRESLEALLGRLRDRDPAIAVHVLDEDDLVVAHSDQAAAFLEQILSDFRRATRGGPPQATEDADEGRQEHESTAPRSRRIVRVEVKQDEDGNRSIRTFEERLPAAKGGEEAGAEELEQALFDVRDLDDGRRQLLWGLIHQHLGPSLRLEHFEDGRIVVVGSRDDLGLVGQLLAKLRGAKKDPDGTITFEVTAAGHTSAQDHHEALEKAERWLAEHKAYAARASKARQHAEDARRRATEAAEVAEAATIEAIRAEVRALRAEIREIKEILLERRAAAR